MLSVPVWFFVCVFFQLKLDKGMEGCECKSRYTWQKVVSANVYDATVTLTMKERWKAAKCHKRGILTEVTSFGPRSFLGAHNDLTHSVTSTPSSRPPPSPRPRQLTRSGRNRKTKQTKNKTKNISGRLKSESRLNGPCATKKTKRVHSL